MSSGGTIPASADPRPLRYIVEALRQIVDTVRAFGLDEPAQLLERARIDIEASLPEKLGERDSH